MYTSLQNFWICWFVPVHHLWEMDGWYLKIKVLPLALLSRVLTFQRRQWSTLPLKLRHNLSAFADANLLYEDKLDVRRTLSWRGTLVRSDVNLPEGSEYICSVGKLLLSPLSCFDLWCFPKAVFPVRCRQLKKKNHTTVYSCYHFL